MFIASSVFLALTVVSASQERWGDNWDNIRKAMAGVQSIKANFVQKKNLKILAKPLVSKGVFFYRAPEDLRWEYTSPIKKVLLVNRDMVKSYIWEEGDYVQDAGAKLEATRIVMEQIASWLRGDYEENDAFVPQLKVAARTRIELIPAKDFLKEFITRVTLTLSDTPGIITFIEISEPHGSSTILEFTDISLNKSIPDTIFNRVK